MLRVGFDTSALDQRFKEHAWRGTGRYVRALKSYFDRNSYHNQITDTDVSIGYFDHGVSKESSLLQLAKHLPLARKTVAQQIIYPVSLQRQTATNFDVLHFPAHVDAPSWGLRSTVVTVLDLIPLVLADLYRAEKPNWRFRFGRWLELKAIENASLILAISENTANDVTRLLGVARERIVVTPLGVEATYFEPADFASDQEIRSRHNIATGTPILLAVGGIDPRKNWRALLNILAECISDKDCKNPVLCIVGRIEQDDQYPLLLQTIREKGLENNVRLTGFLEERELFGIYKASSLLLFPSLYEGFGLTALEAMALGTPVVCSDNSSLPEVVGSAALTFNAQDIKAAYQAVKTILTDRSLAESLSAQGKIRAKLFSWDETGRKTIAAYQHLAKLVGQPNAA